MLPAGDGRRGPGALRGIGVLRSRVQTRGAGTRSRQLVSYFGGAQGPDRQKHRRWVFGGVCGVGLTTAARCSPATARRAACPGRFAPNRKSGTKAKATAVNAAETKISGLS